MTHFIVYRTTHIPTGRFYVGRHVTDNLDDGYLGSGTIISNMKKKYPREEFIREVLHTCDTFDGMIQQECDVIEEVLDEPLCMNLVLGDASSRRGISKLSEEAKQFRRDRMRQPETREKLRQIMLNRDPEIARKIGLKHRGKTISDETKKKMSEALTGAKNPRALTWQIDYEDGRPSESIAGLKKWCRDRDLKYTTVWFRGTKGDPTYRDGFRILAASS